MSHRYFRIQLRYCGTQNGHRSELGICRATWNGKQARLRFDLENRARLLPDSLVPVIPRVVRRHVRQFLTKVDWRELGGKYPITWDPDTGIETEVTEV